jgi:N-[(2S)-2-amino-2-carboxyethyl]-L-glutamate dehydrogenase
VSPHLAEQLTGGRDFLDGTLDDVMAGRIALPTGRPVDFSPFGLGVLASRSASTSTTRSAVSGELHVIDGFFHELRRYG